MLSFQPARGRKGLLGVFCVAKKSDQLRLVFDTRVATCYFNAPPLYSAPLGFRLLRHRIEGRPLSCRFSRHDRIVLSSTHRFGSTHVLRVGGCAADGWTGPPS
eukprot:7315999-Pyramimonas_sp.AAC.1